MAFALALALLLNRYSYVKMALPLPCRYYSGMG